MARSDMYRKLPWTGGDARSVAEIVNNLVEGKSNNTGEITLATGNATTTTLFDERIGYNSYIALMPVSDAAEADTLPYGSFSNNTDQTAPSVGSTAVVVYDTTEESNGVYLSNSSRLNVRNAGVYNVQFSLQFANQDNAPQFADVWFRVNGTDVPRSASRFDIQPRKSSTEWSHVIGTVNILLDMNANDYVQIAGTTSSTLVVLESYPADASIPRPAIPSAIVTVTYIAPLSTSSVYISAQQTGQATISHFANNTSGKTYRYIIVG
jgi:hypothetical protein